MSKEMDFVSTGLKLVEHGYRIIPVRAGQKRPGLDDWQLLHATPGMVKKWANNGFANGNIGILTTNNPAIDLDIYDAEMAEKMEAWCLDEFGDTPVRIGRAPKRLLMYTTDVPFAKMWTEWIDTRGTKHKVEILGDGQQFVAYGIHPDTKQPFRWMSMDEPLDTPADMVPSLSFEQAQSVLAKFNEFAKAAGWTFKHASDGRGQRGSIEGGDDANALVNFKPRLKLSRAEIEHALQFTDDADDYDRWIMVGMALHHQSNGHPLGLEMWQEWSSQAHNYDGDACAYKWTSFSENPNHHSAVTFASVLKISHEREKAAKVEEFNRVLNVLRTCNSEDEIFGPIVKQLSKAITSDFQMDLVAKKMQDRLYEITQVKPRIETVRKALLNAARDNDGEKSGKQQVPDWCDGWVYMQNADSFYNVDSNVELSERGFNALYDRLVLTDEDRMLGVAIPSSRAAALALNIYNIPTVHSTVYLPGMNKLIEVDGRLRANTFDENTIPPAKEPETADERAAIKRIEDHFELLLEDPQERTMVIDWLAYNVQHLAEKIVWGIVMQGVEGAGKTTLQVMMQRVLGNQNVGPVSATELQDKFTGWGEGRKMVFIEEIRLHGSNRFEIIDKMKPFVSNLDVTIRRMNRDSYNIPNVTNYLAFTNYWDGMPFARMDRRWYVCATKFQTKEQLQAFNEEHPDYFSSLYDAIYEHADVIRWWFLNRKLSAAFQPKRPAIDTSAKLKMRDLSDGSDENDALNDVLETSTALDVSDKLLNADSLKAAMDTQGVAVPYGRAFNTMLSKAGFHFLGRYRLSHGGPNVRWYSRHPHLFPKGGEIGAIRAMLAGNEPTTPVDAFDEVDPFS